MEQQPLLRKETRLPWLKVVLVGIILFGNTFSLSMIFPFLPFMVHDFFPSRPASQIGFEAGYLGSAFSTGSFCAAYLWGSIADRIGRKPVLMLGLLGTTFSIILFGTSQSFASALTSRFLWGILNGNIGVAKAYLAEILDDSNTARGFAIIGIQSGFGRLLGPAIGGLLSNPAERFETLDTPFFQRFPYLLPCVIAAIVALSGFFGTMCFLKETLVRGRGGAMMTTTTSTIGLSDLLQQKDVLYSTSLYSLLAFIGLLSNEVIPLWLLTTPEEGGFDFSTVEIGQLYSISAPFEIVYQAYVFPLLASRYGALGFIRRSFIALGLAIFILPFSRSIANAAYITLGINPWIILVPAFNVMVLARLSCFVNVFVLVNNSATSATRGRVNGIGQTMASASRILAPTISATLFAWTQASHLPFPLNFHLIFTIACILCFVAYSISLRLHDSINKAKV